MNQQEVLIGKASYGRNNFGHGWFRVDDNKDNVYRVLPPMKSLAATGRYAKYYRTHRGFRGSDNKQKPFLCIEEIDYKTKIIKAHCPVCDWVRAIEAEVEKYKEKGATKEQLQEYRNKYVFPFQAEGKYYLNVVNQEGKIGILPIGSNMFKSLEALAIEQEKQGNDITGMNGLFLNFKKQTKFKGDKNAIHTVSLYFQPDGTGGFRPVAHQITQEFAQRLGTEAADLGNLFKSLEVEQISQIISLDGEARAKYIDTLFGKEETQAPVTAPQQAASQQAVSAAPPAGLAQQVQAQAPAAPVQQAPAMTLPPPTAQFGGPVGQGGQGGQAAGAAQVQQQAPAVNVPAMGASQGGGTLPPPSNIMPQQQPVQFTPPTVPGASMGMLNDDEFVNVMKNK